MYVHVHVHTLTPLSSSLPPKSASLSWKTPLLWPSSLSTLSSPLTCGPRSSRKLPTESASAWWPLT